MRLSLGHTMLEISYPLACLMTTILLIDHSMNVWICFLAALMHEGGHLLVLQCCHTPPRHIRLSLFDIAIVDRQTYRHTRSQALAITLAGITVNFLSALIGWLLWRITSWTWLPVFVTAHLTLGLFNALPVSSLDGGQALCLLLSQRYSPRTTQRILTVLSVAVLLPTACLGFYWLLKTRYNFTLLLVSLYLLVVLLKE